MFRIRPALALLVDLRDIELDFKIGGRTVQQGAKFCNSLIGLRVFAEQQRLRDQDGTVLRIGVDGFARGVERFGNVARLAVGVHDHDARPAVFLGAQAQHFFKRVHRRGVIARFADTAVRAAGTGWPACAGATA